MVQELLPKLVSQLEESREAADAKEERDRLVQVGMEYLRMQYETQKHQETVGLATIAAFAALLSGLLGGTEGWVTQTVFNKGLVAAIFLVLAAGIITAGDAAYQVRRMVFRLKDIKSEEEFYNLARIGGFRVSSWLSQALIGLAWTLIIYFVLMNLN